MQPVLFFIPGLAGSQLTSTGFFPTVQWVGYSQLALGGFSALALSSDGVTPLPPDGIAVNVGGPLASYYEDSITLLASQLPGYVIAPWGWDFRLDLLAIGSGLAGAIRRSATPDNPCVIVAHSAGGLVARIAWSSLVASGETALVSRIITMGTPHQGSYSVVQLWSGGNSTVLSVAVIATLIAAVLGAGGVPPNPAGGAYTRSQLIAVIATWPSFYEVMPLLGSADSAADPFRQALYVASNWEGVRLSQAWLTYAASSYATLVRSASSVPPSNVLTTVAGSGFTTPDVLNLPSQLGSTSAYGATTLGDGAVTVEDALIPESWQYTLNAAHADLPWAFVSSGQCAKEVVAVRVPPPPVPAIDVSDTAATPRLGPPPFDQLGYGLVTVTQMNGGDC